MNIEMSGSEDEQHWSDLRIGVVNVVHGGTAAYWICMGRLPPSYDHPIDILLQMTQRQLIMWGSA